MLTNTELLKQFRDHKEKSERGLSIQKKEAKENQHFYVGDRNVYNVGAKNSDARESVVFNRVRPIVQSINGFMIQMRRKPDYQARIMDNEQQQEFSQSINAFSDYLRENANSDQIESRQDQEMLIQGVAATDTSVWYERNPHGEIKMENVSLFDVLWDSQAREKNILDSRWVIRRKKFTLAEALERFKGSSPMDFEQDVDSQAQGELVGVNLGLANQVILDIDDIDTNLVSIWSYQYFEIKKYFRAPNPLTSIQDESLAQQLLLAMENIRAIRSEITEEEDIVEDVFSFDPQSDVLVVPPDIKDDLEELLSRFGIDIDFIEERRRVYMTAIISGEKVFDKFVSPDQNGFTVKFKTGDYDERNKRWLGVVDGLREPARYANKSLTEMLYVIASNSKGGVLYEEDAVDDPQRFEKQYASTRAAIMVAPGGVSQGKIKPKATAQLPNGYSEIFAISNNSIPQMAGVNPEFLASSENKQVSAIFESQRIKQVVSGLAPYFDAITLYQKEQARMMVTFMQMIAENSPGRLIRVIGEDGAASFIQILEENFAGEYDVDIGESPESASQKQETSQTLLGLAQQLLPFGINLYPVATRYLNIKRKDINELLQLLNPPQQPPDPAQQQQQQQQQELLMQAQQAQIENQLADTEFKQAGTLERAAKADNINADTDKTAADTAQTQLENVVIRNTPVETLNVNI